MTEDPSIHLIDEFGELSRRLKEFEPIADRHEQLRKYFAGQYATEPGDEAFTLEGQRYDVRIGVKGNQRKIVNLSKLRKLLGMDLFLRLARVNLSDIDAHVSATDQVGIVTEDRTGPRRVEALLRPIPIDQARKRK